MRHVKIDDAEWLDLQFDAERAREKYGIDIPGFPSDATRITFTGIADRRDLELAFSFYRYALSVSGIAKLEAPRIMDFGAGWGRIARLFLRETSPQNIVTADASSFAIDCLRQTGARFQILHNPALPPIPDFRQTFHLIYAYSVFSHLSEPYMRAWLDYLLTLLEPGGHLIFTTRGERFIKNLATMKAFIPNSDDEKLAGVGKYVQRVKDNILDPETIQRRFKSGEFQFFPIGHPHLPDGCSGDTVIPQSYFEKHYGRYLAAFTEQPSDLEQSVVVFTKPATALRSFWRGVMPRKARMMLRALR